MPLHHDEAVLNLQQMSWKLTQDLFNAKEDIRRHHCKLPKQISVNGYLDSTNTARQVNYATISMKINIVI